MFYDNYVRLCNSIGKTPSAVALEIGIAKPTVSRWKGGSKPNHATVLKVADYFGVPVSELIGGEQKEKPPAQGGEPIGPNKRALLELADDMSEEEAAALLELVKLTRKMRGVK